VGTAVYDAHGDRLGDITQYDASHSLLMIEQVIFPPKVMLVPFRALRDSDVDGVASIWRCPAMHR
jgi:hypothetical protein